MRNGISIFLLSIVLTVHTPVGQLLKLPLLIEHFIKHQQRSGISLIDFFAEHYSSQHEDADLPEDNQLPFKNTLFYSIGFAILSPAASVQAFNKSIAEAKIVPVLSYHPQQHLHSIFRPPRM